MKFRKIMSYVEKILDKTDPNLEQEINTTQNSADGSCDLSLEMNKYLKQVDKKPSLVDTFITEKFIPTIKKENDDFIKFQKSIPESTDSSAVTEKDIKISERVCPQNRQEKILSKLFSSALKRFVPGFKVAFDTANQELKKESFKVKLARWGSKLFHGATRDCDAKEANSTLKCMGNLLVATLNPLNHIIPSRKRGIWGIIEKACDWYENSESAHRIRLDLKTLWGLIPPTNPIEMPMFGIKTFMHGNRTLNPLEENEFGLYVDYLKYYHPKLYAQKLDTLKQEIEGLPPMTKAKFTKLLTNPKENNLDNKSNQQIIENTDVVSLLNKQNKLLEKLVEGHQNYQDTVDRIRKPLAYANKQKQMSVPNRNILNFKEKDQSAER